MNAGNMLIERTIRKHIEDRMFKGKIIIVYGARQVGKTTLISERMKYNRNNRIDVNAYFWRSHQQQEIDYLEDDGDHLSGFEIKWGTKKHRIPKVFLSTYKDSTIEKIDKTNFMQFVHG